MANGTNTVCIPQGKRKPGGTHTILPSLHSLSALGGYNKDEITLHGESLSSPALDTAQGWWLMMSTDDGASECCTNHTNSGHY